MKKIPTLYKKNPENLGLVIDQINDGCEWVLTDRCVKATRKFDGSAAAIIDGVLYKRYDVKKGRKVPENAIPCQEPDAITGHWPHWVKCSWDNPDDIYFIAAFENMGGQIYQHDGTYELVGPKINGNRERYETHQLVRHGEDNLFMSLFIKRPDGTGIYDFERFKQILTDEDIEGIVFHHPDGRMCKLRKSDFGIKR